MWRYVWMSVFTRLQQIVRTLWIANAIELLVRDEPQVVELDSNGQTGPFKAI